MKLKTGSKKILSVVCSNRIKFPNSSFLHSLKKNKKAAMLYIFQSKKKTGAQRTDNIVSIFSNGTGKSNAQNLALKLLRKSNVFKDFLIDKEDVLAITDDDCQITNNWFKEINASFQKHDFSLVFGKTLPYQIDLHPNEFCPSVFYKTNGEKLLSNPHWLSVGFGNNMAVKWEVFLNIGGFKRWLGPGSLLTSAEDGEFILRSQIAGYKIGFNEKMVVYHDKWLSADQYRKQEISYARGGIAAYSFYYFQGVVELKEPILSILKSFRDRISDDAKEVLSNHRHLFAFIRLFLLEIFSISLGITAGFIFAKIVPIPEKENVVKRFYNKKN